DTGSRGVGRLGGATAVGSRSQVTISGSVLPSPPPVCPEQERAVGERFGRTMDRDLTSYNQLALEFEAGVTGGAKQLGSVEHPAYVFRCVPVSVRALQADETRVPLY